MLTLLALAIQTASISTPGAETAMKCGSAIIATNGKAPPSLQTTSHFMYFVMQAAKDDPGNKPFLDRVSELVASVTKEEAPALEAARTLIASCDRSFPLARTTIPPRLPANAFDRDVMCLGALSVLRGPAEEMRGRGPDGGAAARIDAALKPLAQRFDGEALAKRGIAGEAALISAMEEQLKTSLSLGNMQTIGRACGVTGI
jgi:hypothetical protein